MTLDLNLTDCEEHGRVLHEEQVEVAISILKFEELVLVHRVQSVEQMPPAPGSLNNQSLSLVLLLLAL